MSDRKLVARIALAVLAFMVAPLVHAQAIPVTVTASPATSAGTDPVTVTWNAAGATTCTASGAWSGTKAASGSQVIAPPLAATARFDLSCSTPGVLGATVLSWPAPPTLNTNGAPLTNLAGYLIEYGTSAATLSQSMQVNNPAATSATVPGLASGTWYFSVRAVNSASGAGPPSNPVSAPVTATAARSGSGSATHTVNPVPQPPSNVTVRTVDQVAYEMKSSGSELLASPIGVIPMGAVCGGEIKVADGVTYNRVDEDRISFVAIPARTAPIEAWAKCG